MPGWNIFQHILSIFTLGPYYRSRFTNDRVALVASYDMMQGNPIIYGILIC